MNGLIATELSKSFGGKQVLRDVSLSCAAGEVLVVMGRSGSGKTTLLRLLNSLIEPDSGSVQVGQKSEPVFSYMPQRDSLLPWLDVSRNVLVPLGVGRAKRSIEQSDLERQTMLLDRFDISGSERMRPSQLSGGMRQRVALARSLILKPDVLLLDEPFGALDEVVRHRVETEVRQFVREAAIACVLITHSVDQALAMGDRIALLPAEPAALLDICAIDPNERPLPPARYGEMRAKILGQIYAYG